MCEERENIRFCTCGDESELDNLAAKKLAFESTFVEGEYSKKYFGWILMRVQGEIEKEEIPEDVVIMGSIVMPKKRYDDKVTIKSIVKELNEEDVFDFEYLPEEGDEITVFQRYKYIQLEEFPRGSVIGPMTFVYEKNEWYFGYVSSYDYIKKEVYSGIMKKVSNKTKQNMD